MILADINVLVYAFDESSPKHERYANWLAGTLAGADTFALVDTVLSGFIRIVTHPKIFADPAPVALAMQFVDTIIEAPAAAWVSPNRAVWQAFSRLATIDTAIRGNLVPDAYLASVATAYGTRLATADRGFARYAGLDWFDPAG
ncbi:MAG: TA system VapC family ribonuclease toxin [Lacisediminihabitans sp.]